MFRKIVHALLLAPLVFANPSALADEASDAQAYLEQHTSRQNDWAGPTRGPGGREDITIAVLPGDLHNGGILGSTRGIVKAAIVLGWKVRVLDGAGTVEGRTNAFEQALALGPDGIVINGYDAYEQRPNMQQASDAGIAMVAWHAASTVGPIEELDIFANVTTDAMEVARAAATWAWLDADGEPGVVIFTDSTYQIAIDKADRMQEVIEELGGTVLDYIDSPLSDTEKLIPDLTVDLLERHGDAWTHSLAINDLYFDSMSATLSEAGVHGNGAPVNVAAGDGSDTAFERVRRGEHQAVTVAEPLTLQGWQLLDEMNRALAGETWSGYVPPLRVVTQENIEFDGGPNNSFDPENGYQEAYSTIWSGASAGE